VKKDIKKMMESLDFLGISNYAPMSSRIQLSEFENGAIIFEKELAILGINLTTLRKKNPKLVFTYSELGIGGGFRFFDNKAKTPSEAAATPNAGITYQYSKTTDPWATPQMTAFKHHYYKQLVAWRQASRTYRVDHVNLWNVASWDHLGVYSEEYRDDVVVKIVKAWNDRCIR
jgi:hypothetical protein